MFFWLPMNNLVDDLALLQRTLPQIDPGSSDVLMAEEVGQQGEVAVLFQEVLCVSVTEGVGVDNSRVDSIFPGIEGQSAGDSPSRDTLSVSVQEQIAAIPV